MPELKDIATDCDCGQAVPPAFSLPAHVTGIDLRFYTGTQFPARYRNALFLSLHGSTTIPEKVGYKVVRIVMKDGRPVGLEDFVTGWLKEESSLAVPQGWRRVPTARSMCRTTTRGSSIGSHTTTCP